MRCRGLGLLILCACLAPLALPGQASAAVTCPNPVPVVNENNCMGAGSTAWRLTDYDPGAITGYATQSSVNLGSSVTLRIARDGGTATAAVTVFRIGWYGGAGGRLVYSAPSVTVNNGSRGCDPPDSTTGLLECANWDDTMTIPAASLPASGVYLARIRDLSTGADNQVIFTVRDDGRQSEILYKLPTATYQAYNSFGGKSLYDFNSAGANTVTGTPRAVKVSFDRPFNNVGSEPNWFLKADYPLVSWLERQGYDIGYTDSVSVNSNPGQLLQHDDLVLSGHDEYWSGGELAAYKAARNAGVDITSFSANTAYWKVRYEDGGRTVVCYKTVQGNGTSGAQGVNDWGPDGVHGTADDALGLDGVAGTSDDKPQNSTTTFRDNGAPPGDSNAPPGGRVGPNEPENSLLGAMYVGDNNNSYYPITVPPANQAGDYAGDRIWRGTGIAPGSGATIGSNLTGWEWDSIPTQAQYLAQQPAGVKRVSETNVGTAPSPPAWLQDEGRVYNTTPPPGQPSTVSAVKYTATSGALVFHSGTIQWSWGLAPHFLNSPSGNTYMDPPVDSSDPRIQQATYNLFADTGVQPNTPSGINLEGNTAPEASLAVSPNPAQTGQSVSFDASGSTDVDGTIAKYEWDLDGNGTYETDTGTTPTAQRTYSSQGSISIGLRVTDNGGATDSATKNLVINNGSAVGDYATAVLATPGLAHYWRLGEVSGTTLTDSVGGSNATAQGGVTLGAQSSQPDDPDTSASFDGTNDSALASVDLSGTSKVTLEFWMKWTAYSNDDDLAFELTPNFNNNDGGILVDPNDSSGQFGVGIGRGASRNTAYFARPSTGTWHHYALVLDSTAAAAQQITPYVDGHAVAFTKSASGTGAGPFANSTLSFMSRNATSLFGNGLLDEVAVYDRALDAATIGAHFDTDLNQPPSASFTVTPNPATTGQSVAFNAAASSDPDGTISKYEWDLDGNGSYETDTGTTATTSRTYASAGNLTVGLRVTDNQGDTATTTRSLVVHSGSPTGAYASAVLGTAGLAHYWRLGEQTGTSLNDSIGNSDATAQGGVTLGAQSPLPDDTDTAAGFDGANDAGLASVDLSATSKVTLEFWMNWAAYSNDDDLAFELTPNFNNNDGGILVDPNDSSGQFGVGIGRDASRNNVRFARPSAGAWHHYAFVLDSTAAAAQQVTPYVDGQAVAFTKSATGTGAGNFANSTLSFMSRNASSLFGNGVLDEVAVYDRALTAGTIAAHFDAQDQNVTPSASFTVAPNPAQTGQSVAFNAAASSDPDGTISKYEWDLDGNGSYETDTGTTATTSRTYASAGNLTVGLRVTDNDGATATTTRTLSVHGSYAARVTATPGLAHYWRLGEVSGTTLTDSVGNSDATAQGGVTLGAQSSQPDDPDTSASFDGTNDAAIAPVDLSGTSKVTLEFWMKWTAYSNDDDLAFELTPNFNNNDGGILVDPNDSTGQFGIGIGRGASRNTAYFARPSTGTWHHYALALDTTAPAAQQITPYVDGQPVAFTKSASGTGAGPFANSTLGFMSRNAAGLFGNGLLDDVAVYDRALDATTIAAHVGTSGNQQPSASFTVTPNPATTGQSVAFNAAASSDPDGTISKYEWDLDGNGSYETDTGTTATTSRTYAAAANLTVGLRVTDNQGATATTTRSLVVTAPNQQPSASFTVTPNPATTGQSVAFNAAASSDPDGTISKYEWDLDGNGSYETDTGTTATTSRTYAAAANLTVGLRVTDNQGATATTTRSLVVTAPNQQPSASFTVTPNPATTGQSVAFNAAASSDPDGTISKYEWDLDGNGSYETDTGTTATTSRTYAAAANLTVGLRVTDNQGATATTTRSLVVTAPNQQPSASFTVTPNPATTGQSVAFNAAASSDPDGTISKYEWDLDGNGSYETDTGTTATTSRTYAAAANLTVGLRVTDNQGATATTTRALTVRGSYNAAVLGTTGLIDYWRLGETSGTSLADVIGGRTATALGGVTLGVADPLTNDSNTAASFDGTNDTARTTSINLSGTSQLTVEFWMRWTSFSNNDDLAMEFTPNSNQNNGGFFIDPNASGSSSRFGVGIGRLLSRNGVVFTRPSAGVWHHYAFVLNSAAPAATQVIPYVDGQPVSYVKSGSGTGAGSFANSTLSMMSRSAGAGSLFGAGALDEVALYSRALSAAEIAGHYQVR